MGWWCIWGGVQNARQGGGLCQKLKTEVLWLSSKLTMYNVNGQQCMRWWCGCAFVKHEVGFGPKTEAEVLWLSFGHTVWNGNGGWCVGVGRWCIQCGGGGGVVHLKEGEEGRGLGSKNQNWAAVAWFQAAIGLQEVKRGAIVLQRPLLC